MFCCIKKKIKKPVPLKEQKEQKLEDQIAENYKMFQLVYTPAPPIKQLPSTILQEDDPQTKGHQKGKRAGVEIVKKQKPIVYFQQYPLYPPFAARQKMRKQKQYIHTERSYFNLIKKINFNARNEPHGDHNEEYEEMFLTTPMIRTFSYHQRVIDVSDHYIGYFHQQFESQRQRNKQRLRLKQIQHLKYLQQTRLQSEANDQKKVP